MSPPTLRSADRGDSPDPSSHAATIYDQPLDSLNAGPSDDDDMDFDPTTNETTEDSEYFELNEEDESTDAPDQDDESGELEFHDAADEGTEIQLNIATAGDGSAHVQVTQQAGEGEDGSVPMAISRAQILRLLNTTHLRRLLQLHGDGGSGLVSVEQDDDDDGDEYEEGRYLRSGRRRRTEPTFQPPPVPSPEGQRLMGEGVFGRNEEWEDDIRKRRKKVARRLMMRELGLDAYGAKKEDDFISQYCLPSSKADKIIHYDSKSYSGEFSRDGNFFFSCAQDFNVRMYDTSNPFDWKYYKSVPYLGGQWTITDATLSPDNRFLAYSSIRSAVCLASTDPGDNSDPFMLDFADHADSGRRRGWRYGGFGIWSVRFSGDGRELVAGTGDNSVNVYDLHNNKTILRIPAHDDDVNAVCYGDSASPHVLYSGSDDTLIKVWDRRSMGDNRPAGLFVGHTEGLTYVDSRGDGRYVLSNAKDQTMKLWDLRKMLSHEDTADLDWRKHTTNFDYRFSAFAPRRHRQHPQDCSLVTFLGHSVLRTLIRCHFSPPDSTNSRYVFSGSEDGCVYIYNLDATLAGKIDVKSATFESRPRDPNAFRHSYHHTDDDGSWNTCVRDASWHPHAPMIAATSWNGWGGARGTCTVHSWSDDPEGQEDESGVPMGLRVNHKLEADPSFYDTPNGDRASTRSQLRSWRVGRATALDDDEDDTWP